MTNMASNGNVAVKRKASEIDQVADGGIVHIKFAIRAQDGSKIFFKLNQDRILKIPFMKYCQESNLEYGTINFMLDGKPINGNRQTPRMLKMKNGAEIDAMKHQTGGGGVAMEARGN